MGRRKIKEVLKHSTNNSQIHFVQRILGRLICYTDLEKARSFVEDIYIVLTTERSSDLVEYDVEAIEEKINIFDYAEADLVALKVDEDEHILYNGQVAENENYDEENIVNKSTLSVFRNATGTNAFQIIKNANHQYSQSLLHARFFFS